MNKKIYLFTDTFPYGFAEYTFLKDELSCLHQKGYQVILVSSGEAPERVCEDFLRENQIEVLHYTYKHTGASLIGGAIQTLCSKAFWGEVSQILSGADKDRRLFKIKKSFWYVFHGIKYRNWFQKNISDLDSALLYTYWYHEKTLGLCMLKKMMPELKILTRIHGYDLRHEECESNRQPCKWYMDKFIDRVVFISEEGQSYYIKNFNMKNDDRYRIHYLGAPSAERYDGSYKRSRDCFHIVTCSSIHYQKRLDYVIDALSKVTNHKILWTHIGDGEDRVKIEQYAHEKLDSNAFVQYEFLGFVVRENIYKYYQEVGADCFINISTMEGLPVSIMEALAFGIPVIATDVGGNYETVTDNGYLLSENPSPDETWNTICKMIELSDDEYDAMRRCSYQMWSDKYDAVACAQGFVQSISDFFE